MQQKRTAQELAFNARIERVRDEVRRVEEDVQEFRNTFQQRVRMACKGLADRSLATATALQEHEAELRSLKALVQTAGSQFILQRDGLAVEAALRAEVSQCREMLSQLAADFESLREQMREGPPPPTPLSPPASPVATGLSDSITGVANFPPDVSLKYYIDALEERLARPLTPGKRKKVVKLFELWRCSDGRPHVRRTQKRGKACYALTPRGMEIFAEFVQPVVV
jgi:hypothetical protein